MLNLKNSFKLLFNKNIKLFSALDFTIEYVWEKFIKQILLQNLLRLYNIRNKYGNFFMRLFIYKLMWRFQLGNNLLLFLFK